ncbi:unnamed protein product [Linum trigynum]|uniref:Uncharacterized protein n=1 Tax=Linum trigynum TaxID=586398 RepID=A0AAV2DG48_9ROSI
MDNVRGSTKGGEAETGKFWWRVAGVWRAEANSISKGGWGLEEEDEEGRIRVGWTGSFSVMGNSVIFGLGNGLTGSLFGSGNNVILDL